MFKKLKDKIVEEAKNSPQRFQQITQSVSEKLQSSTADEENFFSIDDDVDSRPSVSTTPIKSNDGGFTSVSLHTSTPIEPRQRRTSNSSMASDVSFLPRYEPGNMYHLQSDIEASASEMEDNVSNSSSKMGHITKEQVYAELQRVRLRYHKYRGRYTDLANHYKDLERENGKMKAVLVETQDISIRRIGELREQCQLEQKAKAHLENALRVEIDERQYIIDTLKTKVDLLNSSNASETIFEADGVLTNGNSTSPPSPEYTQLSVDLGNAKTEIATLNERLQELKASKIIYQTKEANLLTRINDLEAEMTKNTQNNGKLAKLSDLEGKVAKMADLEGKMSKMIDKQEARITELVEEKGKLEGDRLKQIKTEEEHKIHLARDKMTLHTELQNKDLEISNLKSDLDTLKDDLERYEKDSGPKNVANTTKMDNLQGQNTKLIDKVESLTAKCNNMEAELLKMEQLRQENRNLIETVHYLKEVNKGFASELSDINLLKDDLSDVSEALQVSRNDVILLSEEKTDLQQQLEYVIKSNASLNERYSDLNMEHNDLDAKYNKLLIDNTSLSDALIAKNDDLEKIRSDAKSSLLTLEGRITKKLQHKFDQRSEKMCKEHEMKIGKLSVNDENVKEVHVKLLAREDSLKTLADDLANVNDALNVSRIKYDELEANYLELIEENRENIADKVKVQSENNMVEKQVENDQVVIEKLKGLLESRYLELTSLQNRLEVSVLSESTLKENIKQLQQTKDAEETNNVSFLEESLKLKDRDVKILEDKLADSNRKCIEKQDEVDYIKKAELNTAKTLNTILLANNNEITDLKYKLANEEVAATNLNDTILSLNNKIDTLSKQCVKTNEHKLEASKQAEKVIDEKLFIQNQLNIIITDIKVEFANVQTETNRYKTRIEELNVIKANFDEIQFKYSTLREENQRLNVKIDDTAKEMLNLRCTLIESVELTTEKVKEVGVLNKIVDNLTADQKRHKQQIVELHITTEEMAQAVEDKNKCLQEISDLKGNLQRLVNDRQYFEQQAAQFHDIERQNCAIISELTVEREKIARLNDELSLVTVRNRQLAEDRDRLVVDSDRLVVELEQALLMAEEGLKGRTDQQNALLTSDLTSAQAKIASLTCQLDASVSAIQLSHLPNTENFEFTLQEKIAELSEMTRRFEMILMDNKAIKEDLLEVRRLREDVEGERRRLELMVGDMDRSYSEMKHENQLLKDEIQELKITPMNFNTSSKQAIITSNLLNGTNNNATTTEITDFTNEMEQLREKVQQYKAIDATNRTSIEFYESELDRARGRGDKLERKLDETLVTLRHCAELSGVDTQVEYLRHVLYNYMLGREGVVLARVIAAVCKFDSIQTEAVLKHEQQKQTLLGQLGIL